MEINNIQVHLSLKKGGWITFPFLAGTMFCLCLSGSGATSNLIVYLIKDFNAKSIDAAQINNIVNGCTCLAPVAGAIISDSFFGCYPVVAFSTFFNLLSLIVFTLTAAIPSLKPTPCADTLESCTQASPIQLTVLYIAVALLSVGAGGTRFNMMTMGANQFDNPEDQDVFFNWYFVLMYVASIIGATVIVYVQDNVSWVLGFGICTLVALASLVLLMIGRKYYSSVAAGGSPFTGLARVMVAALNNRKIKVGEEHQIYYHGITDCLEAEVQAPTHSFEHPNQPEHARRPDHEQANRVALLLPARLHHNLPASNRRSCPATNGSGFHPNCHRVLKWEPTPLQRLGLGHVVNTVAMLVSALVEKRRACIVRVYGKNEKDDWVVPMSVLWLLFPLAISGLGEALHFPAQVALYYQEFPKALKSTGTGMIALIVAVGFYGSAGVVGLVRRVTKWLPDNINDSKMENVFWMLTVLGTINFGYYLLCAKMYRYKNRKSKDGDKYSNSAN